MKYVKLFSPVVVIAFLLLTVAAQQAKFNVLGKDDALVGEWEWIKDPVGYPYSPFPGQQWTYLKFAAGKELSFAAHTYSADKGYGGLSRFVAYSDGGHITGVLSESFTAADNGKKFSFEFRIDPTVDELIIRANEEEYRYKRKR